MTLVVSARGSSKKPPLVGSTSVLVPSFHAAVRIRHHKKCRSGCSTCKQRKVKCDETKPECLRCIRVGKICGGYEKERKLRPSEPQTTTDRSRNRKLASDASTYRDLGTAEFSSSSRTEPVYWEDNSSSRPFSIPTVSTFVDVYLPWVRARYATGRQVDVIPRLLEFRLYPITTLTMFYRKLTRQVIYRYGPTFVWRPHNSTLEHEAYRKDFLGWMWREPALLEGMFCQTMRMLECNSTNLGCLGTGSMQHYGQSVHLLRRRISDPSAVFDDAVFWAVLVLMVYDLDRQDWPAFEINLDGIRRIVSLRGGPAAVRASSVRSHRFYTWAESCYATRNYSANRAIPTTPPDEEVQSTIALEYFPSPSERLHNTVGEFPEGFRKMTLNNMLEPGTIQIIPRFLNWYETHMSMAPKHEPADSESAIRASLLAELGGKLGQTDLTGRSRALCTAMLGITLSRHPVYLDPRMSSMFSGSMTDFSYVSKQMMSEDCILWLALIFAAMHTIFFVQPKDQWILLRSVVVHQKRSALWADVCARLRTFCAPKELLDVWESCWHIAVQKLPQAGRGL